MSCQVSCTDTAKTREQTLTDNCVVKRIAEESGQSDYDCRSDTRYTRLICTTTQINFLYSNGKQI